MYGSRNVEKISKGSKFGRYEDEYSDRKRNKTWAKRNRKGVRAQKEARAVWNGVSD